MRFKSFMKTAGLLVLAIVAVGFCTDPQSVISLFGGHTLPLSGMMLGIIAPFPIQPELTKIVVAYTNPNHIADLVLPRVKVGLQSFRYRKYDQADSFTVPTTLVGRTSRPNKLEYGNTEVATATQNHGLEAFIPNDDISNAPQGVDPTANHAQNLIRAIDNDREVRVANLVMNASNYGSSNKQTLSGTSQFSDFTNSKPSSIILSALDACIMRPTAMVMGQLVWTTVRQNPDIIKLIYGTASTKGMVTRQDFIDAFEIKNLFVGESWINTATAGQTATLSRAWGKSIALIFQEGINMVDGAVTYGFTAQWQDRVARTTPEKMGIHDGVCVTVGESVKEVITAPDLGYLIANAIA